MTIGSIVNIKEKFFEYLGPVESLASYVRSYKLIFLKCFFESIDSEGKAKVIDVARKFKKFYQDRKSKGLIPDANVDTRIENIDSSTINQVIGVIKDNPYKVINEKGFIEIRRLNDDDYFYLNSNLFSSLSIMDKQNLLNIINEKIILYFDKINNGDISMKNDILKNYFDEIMNKYIKSRTTEIFAQHPIGNILRKDIPHYLSSLDFIDSDIYKIQGSCGQGNWATIPWIAILNKSITATTQEGVYIVYLFSEDMKRLYLTLNQGCTKLANQLGKKGAINKMQQLANEVRQSISSSEFKTDNNLLMGNEYYEQGSIFYKTYEIDQIPSDRELIYDLKQMMSLYKDYYEFIKANPQDSANTRNPSTDSMEEFDVKYEVERISKYIKNKGFTYDETLINNFYLSLKSKPFVILAGTSGTGKSKLVKLFAEAIGATSENGRYNLIPVKPDWSDSTDLLGYRDLQGNFHPGLLTSIILEAMEHPNLPYLICLDEMNLARVEYYLSDILSIMETRRWNGKRIITDKLLKNESLGNNPDAIARYSNIFIPDNLYIIGTVNMDETTFPFSKKVLDRANTIEFSEVNLDINFSDIEEQQTVALPNEFLRPEFLILEECRPHEEILNTTISIIKEINQVLAKSNLHFGYRIRDEICYYVLYNDIYELLTFNQAIDNQILQKILPRIQGSSLSIKRLLVEVFKVCINNQAQNFNYENAGISEDMFNYLKNNNIPYNKSASKIAFMMRRFEEDGFTSYWL